MTLPRPARRRRHLAVAVGMMLLAQTAALAPVSAADPSSGRQATRVSRSKEVKRFSEVKAKKANKKTDLCLTLLHNNDGESALVNAGSGLEDYGGVARFASMHQRLTDEANVGKPDEGETCGTKKYRSEGRNAVVAVSSGDNFLPGPQFDASLQKGVPYYDAIAMELITYDAVAIGNHDFDFGPEVLANFISSFTDGTPFLSANLDVSEEPALQELKEEGRIAKSVIIRKQRRKIGVIGATTPMLPFISSPDDAVADPAVAEAIQKQVQKLKKKEVKIIILISHLQSIDEDIALAAELSGIDIMVAGGGDELLANEEDLLIPGDEENVFGPYPMEATDSNGKTIPVVTTAGGYRYVGHLTAAFDKKGRLQSIGDGSGTARVAGGDEPDAVPEDPAVLAAVTDPVTEHIAELQANVLGETEVPLDGRRSEVRTKETNEGNLAADAMLEAATLAAAAEGDPLPDVALQNGGGIRNDSIIPVGPVTEFDTFSMLPFSNFTAIVQDVEPEQLKAAMENGVSRVEFTDGRFPHIAGMEIVYDPAGDPRTYDESGNVLTEGDRVVSITLDDGTPIVVAGELVPGAPSVNVATINFLANGGDQYPFSAEADNFITYGTTYQQALVNYIVDTLGGVITAADYPEGGEGRVTPI